MAKDLWCGRCETELDWSDLTPPPPGDAESIFCHCGAYAGPGADEVLLIESMTPEERALMEEAKAQILASEKTQTASLEELMAAMSAPPAGSLVAVPNDKGGVDIRITVGDLAGRQLSQVGDAITKAVAKQFGALKRPDPLEPYAAAGKALLATLKPAPEPTPIRIGGGVASFDSAFDGAIRHAMTIDHAEPEPKPHMRVLTFEEKEAERERDRQRIASQWDALRPKG